MEKYFIGFDDSGRLVSRYLGSLYGDKVPQTALEVSEDVFNRTIAETDGAWRRDPAGAITKQPLVLSLDVAKADQLTAVQQAFYNDLAKGFTLTLGYKMDATLAALQQLKSAYDLSVMLGAANMTVIDYDNVAHPNLPLADVETILKEAGSHTQALFLQKHALRTEIAAATTVEAVQAVVWPSV
jgi:hypothetical protein